VEATELGVNDAAGELAKDDVGGVVVGPPVAAADAGVLEPTAGPIGRDAEPLPASAVAAMAIPATHKAAVDAAPASTLPHSILDGRDRIPSDGRHLGTSTKNLAQPLFHVIGHCEFSVLIPVDASARSLASPFAV
jgi:hypothetical protein